MRILIELKQELINAICEIQVKHADLSDIVKQFINTLSEQMAGAETAADLSQSSKTLINSNLRNKWCNPFWYFSAEYELYQKLLGILNCERYSLINLLIQTNREDRQLIQHLEMRQLNLQANSSVSPHLISEYEHRVSSLQARLEIEQSRVKELNEISNTLVEENERLKSEAVVLPLLAKLSKEASFLKLIDSSTLLTVTEKDLLKTHYKLSSTSTAEEIETFIPSFNRR